MPTVNSITNQNNMIGTLSHNLFKLDGAAADRSLLVGGAIKTSASFLKSDFGGQPALTTMVENYTEEKSAFRSELKDTMETLQKSSEQLKTSVQSEGETVEEVSSEDDGETKSNAISTLKESARDDVTSHERNIARQVEPKIHSVQRQEHKAEKTEDNFQKFAKNYLVAEKKEDDEQKTSTDKTENEDDKLTSVKNFVRDYNNAVSYLNENKFSSPLSSLNKNDELTKSLNEIGISVNSKGVLSVNENTLSEALQNNSDKVSSALGSKGLAGQLEKNVDKVNRQSENLFPSIVDYAKKSETNLSESLYSARNTKMAGYYGIHAGNLLNAFT